MEPVIRIRSTSSRVEGYSSFLVSYSVDFMVREGDVRLAAAERREWKIC
jgi:hypothetical protein